MNRIQKFGVEHLSRFTYLSVTVQDIVLYIIIINSKAIINDSE